MEKNAAVYDHGMHRRVIEANLRKKRLSEPTKLEVQLVKVPPASDDIVRPLDASGKIAIKLILHSKVRPGLTSEGYLDPDAEQLPKKIALMAAAYAEHQDTNYGDNHDPDGCAEAAMRGLARLREKGEQVNRSIEGRVE